MISWVNLPNSLSLCRVAVVPVVFYLWGGGCPLGAAACAALAAFTDFLDGRIARATNQVSLTGAILDPVADKFMVMSLFGLLAYHGILPGWLLAATVLRNVSQLLSIPVLMAWKKIPFNVQPRFLPKFASAFSFVLIVFGLASGAPEAKSALAPVVRWIFPGAFVIQGILEIQILVTFWPRFLQILNRKHDTFE